MTNGATTGFSFAMVPFGVSSTSVTSVTGQGSFLNAQTIAQNVYGVPQLFTGSWGGSTGPSLCAIGTGASTFLPSTTTTAALLPGFTAASVVTALTFASSSRIWLSEGTSVTIQSWDYTVATGMWALTSSVKLGSQPFWSMTGRVESGAYILYLSNATGLLAYNTATGATRVVARPATNTAFFGVALPPYNAAFLPLSATPSLTASPSATASASPSESSGALPSASAVATASPGLPSLPARARISTTSGCLAFSELFLFSPTLALVSASAAGGVATSLSTAAAATALHGPQFGNDMLVDLSATETGLVQSACTPGGDWWDVTFAPTPISFAYFVNRGNANTTGASAAITAASGTLSLYNSAGALLSTQFLFASTVTTVAVTALGTGGIASSGFTAPVGPYTPPASDPWQQSMPAQLLGVRYVNVSTAATNQFLNFRELMVFDTTWTNVAYGKPATASAQWAGDANPYFAAYGNNGVIDFDIANGDMVNSATGGGWWYVDLGAVYNVTRIVFFNRAGFTSRSVGATVTYYDGLGYFVGQTVLNAGLIQTYDVTIIPPSSTPTSTPSNSPTSTPSATLQYGAGCPTSYSTTTHFLKTVSFTAANDSTAYVRHCGCKWRAQTGVGWGQGRRSACAATWRVVHRPSDPGGHDEWIGSCAECPNTPAHRHVLSTALPPLLRPQSGGSSCPTSRWTRCRRRTPPPSGAWASMAPPTLCHCSPSTTRQTICRCR